MILYFRHVQHRFRKHNNRGYKRKRYKLTLIEIIEKDMLSLSLMKNLALNETEWRKRIQVDDPKRLS